MTDTRWFDEKTAQLDTSTLTAFGITLTTRHRKAREMVELLAFAEAAARAGVNTHVQEAFYDSNSDCCTFTLATEVEEFSDLAMAIRNAARQTISQFEWFGAADHGRGVQYGPIPPGAEAQD